ncbi:xanthine dehydrogenase molybdopterin binding subunit [Pokkaliibacter plantistimulans]|uniref:Xanthine dehydrogenase molybdopterin binding subunit n=1 Tax=Proteobacteria bacterium 228 TaxID=2083153 RepID=A0A2S5KV58_9PROT|nr:xanthine dehydrogenase molybdopterin binding subunit [Pokkaliibacter plantistimulans]PPC78751.1 xanthine dehydrogenase molybdopterin binding subunit [Pokkaliibacter plantistimulans]
MRKLIEPGMYPSAGSSPVGKAVTHDSAAMQVSGQAQYVDDIPTVPGTLHLVLGLAEQADAEIVSVDLTAVRQSPGVFDVVTLNDVPGHKDIGPVFPGDPLFADGRTLYVGQALFAVAATSEAAARRALASARVEYRAGNPVLDPVQAWRQGRLVRPSHVMQRGDASAALEQAEVVVQGQLDIGGQEHFYLETQATLAIPQEDGSLHLYSSTQHPSEVQKLVAEVVGLPLNQVAVEVRRLGGGFGGKETQAAAPACMAALVAMRTGRPVKIRLNRRDDMRLTGKRHPFVGQFRLGADQSGRISALEMELIGNCGCSPDLSDAIVDRAMFHADNCYYLAHARVSGHRAFTHTASNTAYRGFGGPQGMLAIEAAVDDLARRLQLDPYIVRMNNLYDTDQRNRTHYGQELEQFPVAEMMAKLAEDCQYHQRYQAARAFNADVGNGPLRRGIALTPVKFGISFTAQHLNQAGALVHIYTDGSIQVNHGGIEMGQGLYIKMAQVAADAFDLPLECIRVTATRTDKVPNTSPTAASSGADMNGMAVHDACTTLLGRMRAFAASEFGVDASAISFEGGQVIVGQQRFGFAEFVQKAYFARISLSATGYYRTPLIHYDRARAEGRPFFYFAHGVSCSEVEVDIETGEYRLCQVDILHDVGRSLNPAIDLGQIEGGFVQGLGWLTTEELVWDEQARLRTDMPATYKIPTIGDIPVAFTTRLLERADNPANTIHRSKAVGEPPFMLAISAWCALRDALADLAPGNAIPLSAPATPEAVWKAARTLQAMAVQAQGAAK